MAVVALKDVWLMHKIPFNIKGEVFLETFWAVRNVSFTVGKGESIGIIGENGAGKSTILRLIAGLLKPDRGQINIVGSIAGLLELGAGFQPELSGRDNIYLNASLFGLQQQQIDKKYAQIVEFANLGKFIYAPVKCYSQGMSVRLAFAIAIHMDPDILLIDDTLSVGDGHFQKKCIKKIFELKDQGKTLLFVTHDMNMLRRLCNRTIFLREGRIVRDGSAEEAVPLYTQTAGVKQGVGVLEKDQLRLVFNNGKLFLNWGDILLTPDPGMHAVFRVKDKWHNSFQADWTVEQKQENKLVARGQLYQLDSIQIWRIEVLNNYDININIEMDDSQPLEMQEGCTNLTLTNAYSHWRTYLEADKFPQITEADRYQAALLQENINRNVLCVEAKQNYDKLIPCLGFERGGGAWRADCQIFNSDYLGDCRILQYRILGAQNYSRDRGSSFIYFSGKIAVNIPDARSYIAQVQDEYSISCGKLKLRWEQGRCAISYKDIELTKGEHIATSIYANNKHYHSRLAAWQLRKNAQNTLVAIGRWPGLALTQMWEIIITTEKSFLIKISVDVNEGAQIEEQYLRFIYQIAYTSYRSNYGGGNFPEKFLAYETDLLQRCIPKGEIVLQSRDEQLPDVSMEFAEEAHSFAKIFNSDMSIRKREVRIVKVEPENGTATPKGKQICFETKVTLDTDKKTCAQNSEAKSQNGHLSIYFYSGRGRLFYKKRELTKKLGFYTSVRSEGRWYDSYSYASWMLKGNKNMIEARGKWINLPLSQYWQIILNEDNSINFKIIMRVESKMSMDRQQVNIMLLESYREWVANEKKNSFPDFQGDIDDDWQTIWASGRTHVSNADYIGVCKNRTREVGLPSIKLFMRETNSDWELNIVNSDIYHRGRILQGANKKEAVFMPGEYPYFNGQILIEDF
ncbi:MAG: ABC transporter ATP-binding protein [Candidatus Omnitrophica bacterium]|nr:ABC transporter ATP-binding protein [Candidatus Omnitrophota bacterium]